MNEAMFRDFNDTHGLRNRYKFMKIQWSSNSSNRADS